MISSKQKAFLAIIPAALILSEFLLLPRPVDDQAPVVLVTATTAKPSTPTPSIKQTPIPSVIPTPRPSPPDLTNDPRFKEIALEITSTAENSTLAWWNQYGYIQDLGDGRGYTAGLVGFCSGTGDMLEVINYYDSLKPGNALGQYVPELERLNSLFAENGYSPGGGSEDTSGLPNLPSNWKQAASDPLFQAAQKGERDRVYYNPAVTLAKQDGLGPLGQFAYYDASVNMGGVSDGNFRALRSRAMAASRTPAQGGSEAGYLRAFMYDRLAVMGNNFGPSERVRAEITFLNQGKLQLQMPLSWSMYPGDYYTISAYPYPH